MSKYTTQEKKHFLAEWIPHIHDEMNHYGTLSVESIEALDQPSIMVLEEGLYLPITGEISYFLSNYMKRYYTPNCLDHLNPNECLEYAASLGDMKVLEESIKRGATDFNSALRAATASGQKHIVELMKRRGAFLDSSPKIYYTSKCMDNQTPNECLMYGASIGSTNIVKEAIRLGATDFNKALRIANEFEEMEVAQLLREYGAF